MKLDPKTVHAPEFGQVWLNSPPLKLRELRGRVVLVDFWDFTCINCIRTLPYVKEWDRRYKSSGLVVIGVHAPEFYFARASEVVARGAAEFGLEYPILIDSDYRVWQAFANRYWPSKYLIDTEGYLRYFHAGEGAYDETERAIQELLREIDPAIALPEVMRPLRAIDAPGALATCERPTPELYLGSARGRVANPGGFVEAKVHRYEVGAGPQADVPELGGPWESRPDCLAAPLEPGDEPSRLCLLYSAAEVNLVMCPSIACPVARVDIRENGVPVDPSSRGDHLLSDSAGSYVEARGPRMYSLIRRGRFENALLEVSTRSPGVELFAFTFGSCL